VAIWILPRLALTLRSSGMSFHVSERHGALRGASISVARLRKSEIEFLWVQLEELIEHGKNKDAKTKLGLMQRVYQLLAKTIPTNKTAKKR
jgi:thioredoxin reductase